ncbi:MAG: RICIN domain-containing protein [Eubacterium sp.]|nr:RICIN domain-containing protein [Eubacterium sp.]
MKKTAIFKNSIRKLLTAFLVVCLLITSGLFTVPDASGIPTGTMTVHAADSATALLKYAQSQVGENRQKYLTYVSQWNSSGAHVPWCASFVTYCAHKAGISDYTTERTNWCPNIMSYYYNKGEFHNQNSGYAPKPGDIVFFDWNGCCHDYTSSCKKGHRQHVGIVESVSGGTIYTIEGNASKANYVKRCTRSASKYVIGYASPQRNAAPSGYYITWKPLFGSSLGSSIYDSQSIRVTVTPNESDFTNIVLYIIKPDGKVGTYDMGKNTSVQFSFGNGNDLGTYKFYAAVSNNYGTFYGSATDGCVSMNLMRYDWPSYTIFTQDVVARIRNVASGTYLSATGNANSVAQNVVCNSKKSSATQWWILSKQADGSYVIQSVYNGQALDVLNYGSIDATNVQTYTTGPNIAQKWYLRLAKEGYDNGYPTFYLSPECARSTVLDLDNAGSNDNTNIQTWTMNGGRTQRFAIEFASGISAARSIMPAGSRYDSDIENRMNPSSESLASVGDDIDDTTDGTGDSSEDKPDAIPTDNETDPNFDSDNYVITDAPDTALETDPDVPDPTDVIDIPDPKEKSANSITATKTFEKTGMVNKSQSFMLNAKSTSGKLTYQSNSNYVTVSSDGKVTIKENFCGKAIITVSSPETASFKAASPVAVTINVKPGKMKVSTAKNLKNKKIKVTWKKQTGADRYQVQYSLKSSFKKAKVKNAASAGITIKKLKTGRTYYIRLRAYNNTLKKWGAWSKRKKVKIKK